MEREDLIEVMLDLCRPEIETMARSAHFKNPSIPLQKAREAALKSASEAAKAIADGT